MNPKQLINLKFRCTNVILERIRENVYLEPFL